MPRRPRTTWSAACSQSAGGSVVWDLGANTGRFSRIAASLGRRVVAWDIDPAATEIHYRTVRRDGTTTILPLLGDIAQPSPALGWAAHRAEVDARARRRGRRPGAGPGPPPGDRTKRAARQDRRAVRPVGSEPRHRVRAARGRHGQAAAGDPRGRVRRLFGGGVPHRLHRRFEIRETAAIKGSSRTLFRMQRRS